MHAPNVNFKQARLRVFLDIDIYRKMGVDISHFIFEAPCDSNDQIVNDSLDCSKCSNIFSCSMMQFDVDYVLRRVREAN